MRIFLLVIAYGLSFNLVFLWANDKKSFSLPFSSALFLKHHNQDQPINHFKRSPFTKKIYTEKFYDFPVNFSHPEVKKYINLYRRPYNLLMLNRSLERSRPIALFIYKQIFQKGLPKELFYLPIIESEFLNKAQSHAGALGIWQIMENSITHEMQISEWRDDRLNFWKSTQSALERIQYNYIVLKDWNLALSAYNAGLGKIKTLIKNNNNNYWFLSRNNILPKDTREYIPRFYAVIYLTSHSIENNLRIHWDKSIEWSLVKINQPTSLKEISEKSGIPLAILKMGNQELKKDHIPKEKYPFLLKVPFSWKENVENILMKQLHSKNNLAFEKKVSKVLTYCLQPTLRIVLNTLEYLKTPLATNNRFFKNQTN